MKPPAEEVRENAGRFGPITTALGALVVLISGLLEAGDWSLAATISVVGAAVTIVGLWLLLQAWWDHTRRHSAKLEKVMCHLESEDVRYAVSRMSELNPDLVRAAARNAVLRMMDDNLPALREDLREFHGSGGKLELADAYLANTILRELLDKLPAGSVWLGISRVTGAEWDGEHLKEFLTNARVRTRSNEIHMHRIYAYTSDHECTPVPPETIELERQASVELRRLKFDGNNRNDVPPDVSLVWKRRRGNPTDSGDGGAPDLDDDGIPLPGGYDPVGALEFETVSNGSLVKVTVHSPDSWRYLDLVEAYRRFRGSACKLEQS